MTGYFITGTDTNAGKTWATVALMHYFKRQGLAVAGMKPVASGCVLRHGQWQNDDALLLQQHASKTLRYETINPYAYELPVSPHLAGRDNPVLIGTVTACYAQLQAQADIVLVEGAGGWYAPINATQDISDLARALALPVILVVGVKLGCINHAKLTYQAIVAAGLLCAGWIAVCNDSSLLEREAVIGSVKAALAAPLLGVLPYVAAADFAYLARQLKL
jgi:dethiobiotin synthetase